MEINLKQNEIEAALRQYVAGQGFNLNGRDVKIVFTSGRTANGLTALVDIGDVVAEAKALGGSTQSRSLELRSSDLPSGAVGTAQIALASNVGEAAGGAPADTGGQEQPAVDPVETPAEPIEPVLPGDEPVSLFKPR